MGKRAVSMAIATLGDPEWIEGICRRFSDATGWPLNFAAAGSERFKTISCLQERDHESCWFAGISDGDHRIGFVWMDLPREARDDRSFLAICELSEIVVGLVSDISSSSQSLASRSQDVSTLVNIGLVIQSEENLLPALTQLLQAAVHLTEFRAAAFFLLNSSVNQLSLRADYRLDPMEIPSPQRNRRESPPDFDVMSRGRTLLHAGSSLEDRSRWLPDNVKTAVSVAVRSEEGPIGTLWVFDRRHKEPDERDWNILESIAAQISALLERVVLLRENQDQHRLQQDLKAASMSQEHDIIGELRDDCGFGAAALNSSRFELGGDLCELIPLDKHRTVVAVGDASGDSIPAAMVMSAVRGALRTLLVETPDHLENTEIVVQKLNKALNDITPSHQFMSLIYGVLDMKNNTFTYTNAGHPIPIHFHDSQVSRLESHGLLLGVSVEAVYNHSVIQISANDVLIMYSDGVSEAMNRKRIMFGPDGIINAAENHMGESAQEILEAIRSKLELHLANNGEADDRTLLVVKGSDNFDWRDLGEIGNLIVSPFCGCVRNGVIRRIFRWIQRRTYRPESSRSRFAASWKRFWNR
jgi:sigma-B regulation protein RsbU (phosphoserine phosphatase)